jgi:hypothetical protein
MEKSLRLQFSIRELLLIIAIIALIAGWWIDHERIDRMANQKWEYKIDDYYIFDSELKTGGSQGWEICGAYTTPPSQSPLVILKRRTP